MVFEGHEAMVGDGDAMGVAGEVVENMFGTAEGRLGIDDPVFSAELSKPLAEAIRRGKLVEGVVELEPVLLEQLTEFVRELPAEDPAEHLDGEEEPAR